MDKIPNSNPKIAQIRILKYDREEWVPKNELEKPKEKNKFNMLRHKPFDGP